MARLDHTSAAVYWYMNDLTANIVAETGIPTDIYHLGKIILHSLKSDPDLILHIDGATGESETYGAALKRTVLCARAFREIGLQRGDVIILMAPNHIDLAIPLYAALYLGIIVAPIHDEYSISEIENNFIVTTPKAIFCQSKRMLDVGQVLNNLCLAARVIPFDKGNHECFAEFLEKYGMDQNVNDFRASDLNPDETIACLISTSGSTGPPKSAALSHKSLTITGPYLWSKKNKFPTPTRLALISAPLQWVSALVLFIVAPYLKFPRLQSSSPSTVDHIQYLINNYKPSLAIISPTMITSLLKPGNISHCDLSCLTELFVGGSAVDKDLLAEVRNIIPNAYVQDAYSMSEIAMVAFLGNNMPGSCGQPVAYLEYKLVDTEGSEILEPNVAGELWLKGPGLFKGYYKNPEATKETFVGDWFKTGDTFYRDENWYYFFVERIKSLLKYKSHQISPVELETVIRKHPGVQDVAVTGLADPECGDLPVALVVRKAGYSVTAQEIKDLVKDSLLEAKQLRGGVVFLDALPLTKTTKLDRRKLRDLVVELQRE